MCRLKKMFLSDGWHDRLREERERRGESQPVFGAIGGIKKQTQIAYEQGKSCPDLMYLQALEGAGVDVQYILTGLRTVKVQEPPQAYEADPLNRRKQQVKAIVDQLDEKALEEIQVGIEKIKRMKEMEAELAELRKRIG